MNISLIIQSLQCQAMTREGYPSLMHAKTYINYKFQLVYNKNPLTYLMKAPTFTVSTNLKNRLQPIANKLQPVTRMRTPILLSTNSISPTMPFHS